MLMKKKNRITRLYLPKDNTMSKNPTHNSDNFNCKAKQLNAPENQLMYVIV